MSLVLASLQPGLVPPSAPLLAPLASEPVLVALGLVTLLLFSVVISQPLFYLLALGHTSSALSAPSYIELRQRMNQIIAPRLKYLYLAALTSAVALSVAALSVDAWPTAIGAALAALGLVLDTILALRCNVPINTTIDRWSARAYPPDWHTHRARWNIAFVVRQVVLDGAFVVLLIGMVVSV